MAQGIFKKSLMFSSFMNVLFIMGLLCIPMAVIIYFSENDPDITDIIAFVLFGMFLCLVSSPAVFFNRKAFFYIDNNYNISARFGFGQKLECNISDVLFAHTNMATLTIILKSGKRSDIGGIVNASELCYFIRQRILPDETETVLELKNKLSELKDKRKKGILATCFGFILVFAGISLTLVLTGGRDLSEFSSKDWIIFTVMGCLEILIIAVCFCIANIAGKKIMIIEHTKHRLKGLLYAESPLPPGNIIAVYTDVNRTGRAVIFGYPNDNSVYYSIQEVNDHFDIEVTFSSKIYADLEELKVDLPLDNLLDISDKVLASTKI